MGASFGAVATPVLGAAFLIACMGLLQRHALKGKSSPVRFLAYSYAWLAVLFCAVYVARWGLTTPSHLLPGFWSAVFAGALVNYGIQYLGAKALTYQSGEVSLVSPLSAMTPGLITLLAVTLGEIPGPAGLAGVLLIAGGSWALLYKERPAHWWGYVVPLQRLLLAARYRSLSCEDKERAIVVWLVFGAACLGSIGLLCDGLYVRRGGDMQGLWLGTASVWALLGFGFWTQYLLRPASEAREEWRGEECKFHLSALGYASAIIAAAWLQMPVFAVTFVAYVGTLSRLRILFAVVLGYLIFKEEDIKRRLAVAAAVTVGVLLIAHEGLPEKLSHRIELLGF